MGIGVTGKKYYMLSSRLPTTFYVWRNIAITKKWTTLKIINNNNKKIKKLTFIIMKANIEESQDG